ncbi:hypothetical protein ACFL4Z_03680 [candidate division KSB1 bacterium]
MVLLLDLIILYYETVKEKLGSLHSAKIILYSVDFEEIEKLQHQ